MGKDQDRIKALMDESKVLKEEVERLHKVIHHLRDEEGNSGDDEQVFRSLLDLSPVGIYVTDERGRCSYVNRSWCEMSGLSVSEAKGDGWLNGIHPDDRKRVKTSFERMVENLSEWSLEFRFKNKKGDIFWVFGVAEPVINQEGRLTHFIGVNVDITANKEIEESLNQSREQLRLISENTSDYICITELDMHATFVYLNPSYEKYLGYNTKDLVGTSALNFIHPEDKKNLFPLLRSYVRKKFKGLFTGEQIAVTEIFRYRLADIHGNLHYMECTANVAKNKIIIISKDITETIKSEATLLRQARIIDYLHDAVISIDTEAHVTGWNKGAERLFGYKAAEALKQDISFVFPEEKHAYFKNEIIPSLKAKRIAEVEMELRSRTGESFTALISISSFDDENKVKGIVFVILDISSRTKAEKSMRQSLEDLRQFEVMAVDRELRMVELKREINALSEELGRSAPHILPDGN